MLLCIWAILNESLHHIRADLKSTGANTGA